MRDANGSTASFFRVLLSEAVGPFVVSLDEDDEDGPELIIEAPDSQDVADLDTTVSVHDQLDLLVGEDLADVITEHYARRPFSELADLVDDIREHFGILVPPDTGWPYLVDEIDRYGAAIEKDLFAMPGDERLYDWVRDHLNNPWNRLIRLLPALPKVAGTTRRSATTTSVPRRSSRWSNAASCLLRPNDRRWWAGHTNGRNSPTWSIRYGASSTPRGVRPRSSRARAASRRSRPRVRRLRAIASKSSRPSSSTTTSPRSSSAAATRGATPHRR
ncbi:hypothetical protein BO226_19220 [Rhodococcus sp. 2G]|nr:hypothetical protein BO226_19220 [Rhodococcus sp. 2G]